MKLRTRNLCKSSLVLSMLFGLKNQEIINILQSSCYCLFSPHLGHSSF